MTQLFIIRHGNTFASGETPRRVGGRTDLPLVESGIAQARALGEYFKAHEICPDIVYTSKLQRTIQSAECILDELGVSKALHPSDIFNEIDYGPDEDQPEDAVLSRIGAAAIQKWDEDAIVPPGWDFNPEECIENWKSFSEEVLASYSGKTVMVVTSNGTARFAPYITNDYLGFKNRFRIKLKTGSFGCIQCIGGAWRVTEWGIRP